MFIFLPPLLIAPRKESLSFLPCAYIIAYSALLFYHLFLQTCEQFIFKAYKECLFFGEFGACLLTKCAKWCIIIYRLNIGIRNTVGESRYRGTGCESPTQKRHCECAKRKVRASVPALWRLSHRAVCSA